MLQTRRSHWVAYVQAMGVTGATARSMSAAKSRQRSTAGSRKSFEAQARLAWKNIFAQLHAADMTLKYRQGDDLSFGQAVHRGLSSQGPQHTLQGRQIGLTTIITGIFDEKWLLKIEAIAAASLV